MASDFIYTECMHWINQVQAFRKEAQMVKAELLKTGNYRNNFQEAKENISDFMDIIFSIHKDLDMTEELILTSLNNGRIYWAGQNNTYNLTKIDPIEINLFDRMKNNYNAIIELQRAVTLFLSAQVVA